VFDHFQADATLLCCGCGVVSGVALIDIGLATVLRHLLDLFGQNADPLAVASSASSFSTFRREEIV
jgi:hypothetical protein